MATYVSNRDSAGKTDEKGHLKFSSSSYTGNILSGQKVSQNSPTGMSVRVSAGDIRIPYSNYAHEAWSEGFTSVSISTADPSNPRIDRVVAYVDRSMTFLSTDINNPSALKYMAVAGSPNAVPTKPGDISVIAAVGANNPWCEIGLVRVAAGVTTILDTNITDTRTFVTPIYSTDWRNTGLSVNSVTSNGGGSYDLSVSTDATSYLQRGYRLRAEKSTQSQTQTALFNGTNNNLTRTSASVNGFTFTNTWSILFWYNPQTITSQSIISRQSGGNGFSVNWDTNGRLGMYGYNASSYRGAQALMSPSLNKWTHAACTANMSTNSFNIYQNGWNMYTIPITSGTPTSIVQAGNLEIGTNQGVSFYKGGLANVAVFNVVLTQTQIKQYMSRGITGSEANLVSAWNLNGAVTDINATNSNTLTNNNSTVLTNPSAPYGISGDGTHSATYDYGIIQNITSSVITVQAPHAGTIPADGGIASLYYSNSKVPYGFPSEPSRWTWETMAYGALTITGHSAGNWYFLGSRITSPVGKWKAGYEATIGTDRTAAGRVDTTGTLSTSQTAEVDYRFTGGFGAGATTFQASQINKEDDIDVTTIVDQNLLVQVPSGTSGFGTTYLFGEIGTPSSALKLWIKNGYL